MYADQGRSQRKYHWHLEPRVIPSYPHKQLGKVLSRRHVPRFLGSTESGMFQDYRGSGWDGALRVQGSCGESQRPV